MCKAVPDLWQGIRGTVPMPPNFQGSQMLLKVFYYSLKSDVDLSTVESRLTVENIILSENCAWSPPKWLVRLPEIWIK